MKKGMIIVVLGAALLLPHAAWSHCDTLDGPVVADAKAALASKKVTPVLKWVSKESESEIETAFARTLAVRAQGGAALELADQYFFETVVRVHRLAEGAPYTGLKPAGTMPSPAVAGAEQAIQSGNLQPVLKAISENASDRAEQKLAALREKQKHAGHSVAAGREYVSAYIDYIHYIEGLHQAAVGAHAHSPAAETAEVSTPEVAKEKHHQH